MIEIRRLGPAELDGLLEFMDGPAFKSQPQWQGCYCQFYLNTKAQNDDPNAKQLNRERACERTASGTMQGYLAFDGDRAIGWMAANSFRNFVALPSMPEDVAAIICFVVDQEHQGKGVASSLLRFALEDLPKRGYTEVKSAPLASGELRNSGYRGPRSMFENAGFEPGPMIDDQHILMTRSLSS